MSIGWRWRYCGIRQQGCKQGLAPDSAPWSRGIAKPDFWRKECANLWEFVLKITPRTTLEKLHEAYSNSSLCGKMAEAFYLLNLSISSWAMWKAVFAAGTPA